MRAGRDLMMFKMIVQHGIGFGFGFCHAVAIESVVMKEDGIFFSRMLQSINT